MTLSSWSSCLNFPCTGIAGVATIPSFQLLLIKSHVFTSSSYIMLGSHILRGTQHQRLHHTHSTHKFHTELRSRLFYMRLTIWPNFCPLLCLLIPTMTTKQKHTRKVSTHFPCNLETLKWYGSFPTRKLWSLILFARKLLFRFLLLKYIFKGKVIASNHIQQVVVESLRCGTREGTNLGMILLSEGSQAKSRQSVSDRSSSSPPAGNWTNPGFQLQKLQVLGSNPSSESWANHFTALVSSKRDLGKRKHTAQPLQALLQRALNGCSLNLDLKLHFQKWPQMEGWPLLFISGR